MMTFFIGSKPSYFTVGRGVDSPPRRRTLRHARRSLRELVRFLGSCDGEASELDTFWVKFASLCGFGTSGERLLAFQERLTGCGGPGKVGSTVLKDRAQKA